MTVTDTVSTILLPVAANMSSASTERMLRQFEFTTMASSVAAAGGSGDDDVPSNISMEDLYPALVQCFGIIVCG